MKIRKSGNVLNVTSVQISLELQCQLTLQEEMGKTSRRAMLNTVLTREGKKA